MNQVNIVHRHLARLQLQVHGGIRVKRIILSAQVEHQVVRTDALLHAAKVRLRPILMTTLAMIFGMLPLALALSEGSEQRAPMGQAVIGGVITSSIMTLVVVPVVYCWLDDLGNWVSRLLHRKDPVTAAK